MRLRVRDLGGQLAEVPSPGQAGLLGADQDPAALLATEHLVGRRGGDGREGRQRSPPAGSRCSAERAARRPRPRCERRPACRTATIRSAGMSGARPARSLRASAILASRTASSASRRVVTSATVASSSPSCIPEAALRAHRLLQLFHDLELGVLQIADPLLEVLDLLDHGVQGLGIWHRAVGDPPLVTGEPLTYGVEIGLRAGLFGLQVTHGGVGGHPIRPESVGLGPQPLQLGVLRHCAPSMLQVSDGRVHLLQREEGGLRLRVNLDGALPPPPSDRIGRRDPFYQPRPCVGRVSVGVRGGSSSAPRPAGASPTRGSTRSRCPTGNACPAKRRTSASAA